MRDDNSEKQAAVRVRLAPLPGLVLGVSGARGRYDTDELQTANAAIGRPGPLHQSSVGFDVEYARGYWIVRGESIWTRWDSELIGGGLEGVGSFVEARYKFLPGFYAAARWDDLRFEHVGDADPFTWDAPVTRFEAGAGYQWHRQLLTKLTVQHNRRDGGNVDSDTFVAVQALFWF